ncbi:MAG: hypothetical protein IT196_10410 [Acidimicrobiales bacterium]|nr:hypothetical protein [Acidimicrobiales bacterium]
MGLHRRRITAVRYGRRHRSIAAAALCVAVALLGCTGGEDPDGELASRPAARVPAIGVDEPAPPSTASTLPLSAPVEAGCSGVVTAPASLQDAIDAVTDRTTPYVLCLSGRFAGGGAPASVDRPGLGAYYGGVVIEDRANFTLRGLPGSVITGVVNDGAYPDDDDPPEEQGAVDKGNLIKVVDSTDIVLEWLEVDGRVAPGTGVGPDRDRTLNRLVWFQNVQDSTLRYSRIHHGGGECVRLKANSQRNELHHNEVSDCGYYQFEIQKQERLNKNGEAIYVGTDPTQIAETQINRQRYWGLDPALVSDRSSFNHIHHNVLRPGPPGADWGNECVDLKEDWPEPQADRPGDAERGEPGHNVVADNECSGQFDPESGAFDSRGPNNVFEHNLVTGTVQGAAIRIGAKDKPAGDAGTVAWRATGNVVRLNRLESFDYRSALKVFDDQPLASACGNVDGDGDPDFDGDFSNEEDAAVNRPRCSAADQAPGPRGAVGIPA